MKVILFGDSHLAAVKVGTSRVPDELLAGLSLHFWGTPGGRFRHIAWRDGKIIPLDHLASNAFSRFSGEGLRELDPSLYDVVVFVGARIRPGAVIPGLLGHITHPTRFLTRAYIKAVLAAHLRKHTTYIMARDMAASRATRVLLSPISLATCRSKGDPKRGDFASRASRADLELLWEIMTEIMAEDGVTAVLQPLDTVVAGYMTAEQYGVRIGDVDHKNPDYGALILKEIVWKIGALQG